MSNDRLDLKVSADVTQAQRDLHDVTGSVEKLGEATAKSASANESASRTAPRVTDETQRMDEAMRALHRSLTSVSPEVGAAFSRFASMGASLGAAAAGIAAVAAAFHEMKAAAKEAQRAIRDFNADATKMEERRLGREDRLLKEITRRREPLGAASVDQAVQASIFLENRGVSGSVAGEVAGRFAGVALGPGGVLADQDDLLSVAMAVEQGLYELPSARRSEGARNLSVARFLRGRRRGELQGDVDLVKAIRGRRMDAAGDQLGKGSFHKSWGSTVYDRFGGGISEFVGEGSTAELERALQEVRPGLYEGAALSAKAEELQERAWRRSTFGMDAVNDDNRELDSLLNEVLEVMGKQIHKPDRPQGPGGLQGLRNLLGIGSDDGGRASTAGGSPGRVGGVDVGALFARLDHASRVMMQAAEAQRRAMEAQANAANHRVGVTPPRNWATRTGADAVVEAAEG